MNPPAQLHWMRQFPPRRNFDGLSRKENPILHDKNLHQRQDHPLTSVPPTPIDVTPKQFEGKEVLDVAVSASHVKLSCDCGKFSVVYSSIDHINTT